ncbi:hypothetical protein J4Q44_G00134800 [Coregonus suidteri]|uniref:Uncharacterized protein n=1 Tax=Coregonus suidteri TaxID=861788 RepID=A0AAN8M2U5_9TELE
MLQTATDPANFTSEEITLCRVPTTDSTFLWRTEISDVRLTGLVCGDSSKTLFLLLLLFLHHHVPAAPRGDPQLRQHRAGLPQRAAPAGPVL